MRFLLLLLLAGTLLEASDKAGPDTFRYLKKNSIQINPFGPAGLILNSYAMKITYSRRLNAKYQLTGQARIMQHYMSDSFSSDSSETYSTQSIMLGIRRELVSTCNNKSRVAPYVEVKVDGGKQSYLYENENRPVVSDRRKLYEGTLLNLIGTVGVSLQLRKLLLNLDGGVGPRFIRIYDEQQKITGSVNFALGFCF